jgi:hypothetical protein
LIFRPKNQKGFATISLFLFLPLFLFIVFAFGFVSYFIQIKTQVRSLCLQNSIEIQKNLIASEKKLFALNPTSTLLRILLAQAYADLAKAISTYNPFLAAEASIRISKIEKQKEELDQVQQLIIRTAKLQSTFATQKLLSDLNDIFKKSQSIWGFYLITSTSLHIAHNPEFAVINDFSDDGPNYELHKDYKFRQSLTYKLHHKFSTNEAAQKILKSENHFIISCGTEPAQEGDQWAVKINVGKY